MNNLILDYNPDGNSFASSFGIVPAREREICDIIERCYEDTDTYPHAIVEVSRSVKDYNELVYALFHLGAFTGSEQAKREQMRKLG